MAHDALCHEVIFWSRLFSRLRRPCLNNRRYQSQWLHNGGDPGQLSISQLCAAANEWLIDVTGGY